MALLVVIVLIIFTTLYLDLLGKEQQFDQKIGEKTLSDLIHNIATHIRKNRAIDHQLQNIIGESLGKGVISQGSPLPVDGIPQIEKDNDIKEVPQ